MDVLSILLAPVRIPMRLASALDDLAVLAERAQREPDTIDEVRERVDALILELAQAVEVIKELIAGGAELTQTAKAIDATGLGVLEAARALDETGERVIFGGEDLTRVGILLSAETRELIDGGSELTDVSERLDADLRVFRSVLPRLLEVVGTVEQLEGAVETVADTIEPLQGAAERVGRVTNRLSRSRG